jgi:hypothetical protein
VRKQGKHTNRASAIRPVEPAVSVTDKNKPRTCAHYCSCNTIYTKGRRRYPHSSRVKKSEVRLPEVHPHKNALLALDAQIAKQKAWETAKQPKKPPVQASFMPISPRLRQFRSRQMWSPRTLPQMWLPRRPLKEKARRISLDRSPIRRRLQRKLISKAADAAEDGCESNSNQHTGRSLHSFCLLSHYNMFFVPPSVTQWLVFALF